MYPILFLRENSNSFQLIRDEQRLRPAPRPVHGPVRILEDELDHGGEMLCADPQAERRKAVPNKFIAEIGSKNEGARAEKNNQP